MPIIKTCITPKSSFGSIIWASCWLLLFTPVATATQWCLNGVTPGITGYHPSGYSVVPVQASPQAACSAWYTYSGMEAIFAGSNHKLGMMTTGNDSTLQVLQVSGNYTYWWGTVEWTCDVVPVTAPDIQTCANWSCMGQVLIRPVLQCSGNSDPSNQQTFIIRLSRVDGISVSDSILERIEPKDSQSSVSGKAVSQLVARVDNQNGQPEPDVGIELTVDVIENSGGHKHDHNRNTIQMGLLASAQGTVSQNGKVLSGNTGTAGLAFSFTAPVASGDHVIKAHCTGRTCTQQGPDQVWVGIDGLAAIPSSGFWAFRGETSIHPANHFLSADALGKLMDLGRLYKQVYFPFAKPLQLNDSSLERGGVFDIDWAKYDANGNITERRTAWWKPPHHEHRRGTVIDIQANGSDTAIF